MLEELANTGVATLNPAPATGKATIIILGTPRSGTSMPAKVLDGLGVFLGDRFGRGVFEDQRIAMSIEKNAEPLETVIRDYDSHDIWAFKRPRVFRQLDRCLHLFRNPRLVVMSRDPVAVAIRNNVSMGHEFPACLKNALKEMNDLFDFVGRQTVPVLCVSYEKAMADRAAFVDRLTEFCGINPSGEQRKLATGNMENGPESYLMSSQVRFPRK